MVFDLNLDGAPEKEKNLRRKRQMRRGVKSRTERSAKHTKGQRYFVLFSEALLSTEAGRWWGAKGLPGSIALRIRQTFFAKKKSSYRARAKEMQFFNHSRHNGRGDSLDKCCSSVFSNRTGLCFDF